MTIEADLFFVRRRGPDPLLKSASIQANDIKKFYYPRPARILVVCDQNGEGGAIFIKNPKNIGVTLYKSDDDKGKAIDSGRPIRLEKGQEVIIWSEQSRKELNIYIEDEDEDMSSIEPPYISVDS